MLLTRTDVIPTAATPLTWELLSQSVQETAVTHPALTPILQPLADGWASKLLLARAAPYFYDRASVSTVFDFRTLRPRITAPPFVRALEQLVADQRGDVRRLTPQLVLEEFLAGKAAAAITWPSAANGLETNGPPAVEFPLTVNLLPGSEVRYDYGEESWVERDGVAQVTLLSATGRCGAISRTGRHVELATRFLGWVSGPEFSGMLSSRSSHTAPFRRTHQTAPGDWTDPRITQDAVAGYLMAIAEAMNRPEGVLCLRIPQQHRYLAALDVAVANALDGSSSPQAALSKAAETWDSITDEIGRKTQLKAYQRSLGVD